MTTKVTFNKQSVIAQERLYTDKDRTKVLKEGDKEASILLAAEGGEIPIKLARKLGLVKDDEEAAKAKEPALKPGPSSQAIEHRETRVPHVPQKRD